MSDDGESALDTWEPRPTPTVTPETEPFWLGAAEGELLLGLCPECDLTFFYPRARCPDCLTAAERVPASGTGTIYSYTVPSQISGWPDDALPLIVAYVELDEGPRVISNVVDCDPDDVHIGQSVELDFVSTQEEDVAIPVFRLPASP